MSRRKDSIADVLIFAPWWVSAALAVLAYAGLRWGLPVFTGPNKFNQTLVSGVAKVAPLVAFFFGLLSVLSALLGAKRRRLVDEQTSLDTLRTTSWKDFELFVAEAYRRQGYTVDYSLAKGTDGGVDLVLKQGSLTSLVQCKQWKVFSVGAPVIRELFGILTAQRADQAIVVTTGRFTSEAKAFADGKPIQLVDGPKLLELVRSVQRAPVDGSLAVAAVPNDTPTAPQCPQCGATMVLRIARRGSSLWAKVLGLQRVPPV